MSVSFVPSLLFSKKYFVYIFYTFEISFRIKSLLTVEDPPRFQNITELGTLLIPYITVLLPG